MAKWKGEEVDLKRLQGREGHRYSDMFNRGVCAKEGQSKSEYVMWTMSCGH